MFKFTMQKRAPKRHSSLLSKRDRTERLAGKEAPMGHHNTDAPNLGTTCASITKVPRTHLDFPQANTLGVCDNFNPTNAAKATRQDLI